MSACSGHNQRWRNGSPGSWLGAWGNGVVPLAASPVHRRNADATPLRSLQSTSALEALKARLLEQELAGNGDPLLHPWLRLAAEEAASLAWATSLPLLFMPGLFEEKVAEFRRYFAHQRSVDVRSRRILWGFGFVPAEIEDSQQQSAGKRLHESASACEGP